MGGPAPAPVREQHVNVAAMLSRWWRSDKRLGRVYAIVNLVVGAVFVAVAILDIDLGLGTYARWLFALPFGLVPLLCGLLAFRFGDEPATARPLRLAGDIALWSLMILFTVLALALDEREYGPLLTLLAFLAVTVIGAFVTARKATPAD